MASRSPALVLGPDGEPKQKLPTYDRYEAWKVVIADLETGKKQSKKFFSYKQAKEVQAKLAEKYADDLMKIVHVVSRQTGYGPPYSKVSDLQLLEMNERGHYWCAYCRAFRQFPYNAWRRDNVCEVCSTSLYQDFHNHKCNPLLWDSDSRGRI